MIISVGTLIGIEHLNEKNGEISGKNKHHRFWKELNLVKTKKE